MEFKVIKTESEYQRALVTLESLMELNPEEGTEESEQLELLSLLLQNYESQKFLMEVPSSIDALRFRMESQGLAPRDLIPYLGSRSKVSEVLSGKRPLTLSMMRALNSGLGIPAKLLLQEGDSEEEEEGVIEWEEFPIREMVARGWLSITTATTNTRREAKAVLEGFFAPIGLPLMKAIRFRTTRHVRSARPMDEYALLAWSARIMNKALVNPPETKFKQGSVTIAFMRELTALSILDDAPLRARDYLRERGISLIIEPHLPKTSLDGAAILMETDHPVIGLSIRYDRLDNFWFTLMHEVAHIALHFGGEITQFYDDLEVDPEIEAQRDIQEQEADDLAREALIPLEAWKKSPASHLKSPQAAEHLANKLRIHPAIVAGRMRYEFKAYRLFNNLVGHHQVRLQFPEVIWEK